MSVILRPNSPAGVDPSVRKQELIQYGYWKGNKNNLPLGERPVIVKEDANRFCLHWCVNERMFSVSFWIDKEKFSWCYQNGQAHKLGSLNELISDIFMHYSPINMHK